MSELSLRVEGLAVSYPVRGARHRLQAVAEASFGIAAGSVLGLVGESGSGKSSAARALVGLVRRDAGVITMAGVSWEAGTPVPRPARGAIQMVFQDPYSSLDPVWPIGKSIEEPLRLAANLSPAERRARVEAVMRLVGLDPSMAHRRPKSFSGGQRQRIAIARAVVIEPRVLVCDEAVSALDVSTKNQIIRLLRDLRDRLGVAILFISHDLAVVRQIADEVAVMYRGRIVEIGACDDVLTAPAHPYSRKLLDSVPRVGWQPALPESGLSSKVGDRQDSLGGCVYAPRCSYLNVGRCDLTQPALKEIGSHHRVACIRVGEIDDEPVSTGEAATDVTVSGLLTGAERLLRLER